MYRRSYQDFENGKRAIPSDAIARLYGHFDCDLHTLFTGHPRAISRNDRASFVTVALDAACILLQRFPEMPFSDLRHYATLTAELTEPNEEPEFLWLIEMVAREQAGLPRFGFDDED